MLDPASYGMEFGDISDDSDADSKAPSDDGVELNQKRPGNNCAAERQQVRIIIHPHVLLTKLARFLFRNCKN
jgi:hypothetical protein